MTTNTTVKREEGAGSGRACTRAFVAITLLALLLAGCKPYAATDDQLKGVRSGLTIKKDYGTGCEYLVIRSNHYAAMSIRYGYDGKPVCSGVRHD